MKMNKSVRNFGSHVSVSEKPEDCYKIGTVRAMTHSACHAVDGLGSMIDLIICETIANKKPVRKNTLTKTNDRNYLRKGKWFTDKREADLFYNVNQVTK